MKRITFESGQVLGSSYAFVLTPNGKDLLSYTAGDTPKWKHLTGIWIETTCTPDAKHVEFLKISKAKRATHIFVVWSGSGAAPESLESEAEYRLLIGGNKADKSDLTILFYPIRSGERVFELVRSWDSPSLIALGFAFVDFRWLGGLRNA